MMNWDFVWGLFLISGIVAANVFWVTVVLFLMGKLCSDRK